MAEQKNATEFVAWAYTQKGGLGLMSDRIEAAEARAAQLEIDNDEMQSYINEIRVALHTEKDELTIDAVRRVISERDELRGKLEQAQARIAELDKWLDQDSEAKALYRMKIVELGGNP